MWIDILTWQLDLQTDRCAWCLSLIWVQKFYGSGAETIFEATNTESMCCLETLQLEAISWGEIMASWGLLLKYNARLEVYLRHGQCWMCCRRWIAVRTLSSIKWFYLTKWRFGPWPSSDFVQRGFRRRIHLYSSNYWCTPDTSEPKALSLVFNVHWYCKCDLNP